MENKKRGRTPCLTEKKRGFTFYLVPSLMEEVKARHGKNWHAYISEILKQSLNNSNNETIKSNRGNPKPD